MCFYCYCLNFHHNRGAALLVEAADMGNPDAQYELGCRLRVEVRLPALCTAFNICEYS
jgi:hypothetical protein